MKIYGNVLEIVENVVKIDMKMLEEIFNELLSPRSVYIKLQVLFFSNCVVKLWITNFIFARSLNLIRLLCFSLLISLNK